MIMTSAYVKDLFCFVLNALSKLMPEVNSVDRDREDHSSINTR